MTGPRPLPDPRPTAALGILAWAALLIGSAAIGLGASRLLAKRVGWVQ